MNAPDTPAGRQKPGGSFDDLCRLHSGRAWAFASRLTQCSADADDVIQDAFVVAWKKRDSIPPESWPWFCTVVSNCARNHRRKTGRVQRMAQVDDHSPSKADLPETAAQANELRAELVAALEELAPEEHQAVALCVLGGLTQAAASEMTGTNLNTIKARVRRGLERLREKLKKRPDSIEAFLALPVLPYPTDSLDDAVSRWSDFARGAGSVAAVTGVATRKAVMLACMVLLVVGTGLNVAYNLTHFGRSSPVIGTAPSLLADTPSPEDPAPGAVGPLSANTEPMDAADSAPVAGPTVADFVLAALPDDLRRGDAAQDALIAFTLRYPTGAIRERGTALQTPGGLLRHGHCSHYYDSGELQAEYSYVHGKRQGAWTELHRNGKLSYRAEYVADRKHGLLMYYDEDGTPFASGEYFEDKKVGTWTIFYPNGDHKRLDTYVDGVLSGMRKDFKPGGVLHQTTEYAESKKNGLQIEYSPETGNPVRESHFTDGKKDRPDRLFDPVTGAEQSQ